MDDKLVDRWFRAYASGSLPRREFVRRMLVAGASTTAVASVLAACGSKDEAAPAAAPAPGAPPAPPADELGEIGKELAIYNWSDYIAEDVVPLFEKEFGVKVTYDTYESNEEMMSKLQVGASGYDIVVPSGYILQVLTKQDLLFPLSKKHLTNWGNIATMFHNPTFDPNNTHGVPYMWGTTGIAYRTDKITTPPDSWGLFLDKQHAGKMTMMDDHRDVMGSFLRFRGKSLNATDAESLAAAKADVLAAKPNLKAFISAPVKGQLVAGDVWIAQLWNGDTMQAKAEQPNIGYVLPKEGAPIWTDSLVVPKTAPHKRAAHEFINFLLRPEIAAKIADFTGYGSPNTKGMELSAAKLPFPTAEEMGRLEYHADLGEATQQWDQIWTEIKAS